MTLDNFILATCALICEIIFGYPLGIYHIIGHPVNWMGWALNFGSAKLYREGPILGRCMGVAVVLIVTIAGIVFGYLVTDLFSTRYLPFYLALFGQSVIASAFLAAQSLYNHVNAVSTALTHSLDSARREVAKIVGRDVAQLNESAICKAAIESLAESFSDGVVAPLIWLLIFGLPGIVAYKIINTADSLFGYKTKKWLYFGSFAARLDDVANFFPARLTALLIILGSAITPTTSAISSLRCTLTQARLHPSPNAGWPEAAFAGALKLTLGGVRSYQGEATNYPRFGSGDERLDQSHLNKALTFYCWLIALIIVLLVTKIILLG